MTLQLTKSELANWARHDKYVQKLSKGLKTSPKIRKHATTPDSRKDKARELYAKHGSIGYVCSQLKMSRNTLKNILREHGEY